MNNTLYFSHRDERANIYELQSYLRYLSRYIPQIPIVNPDGIYGPETKRAVEAFQKRFGLSATGEADFETWSRIVEVYDQLVRARRYVRPVHVYPIDFSGFSEGDTMDEIYVLQVMLRRLGRAFGNISPVEITGVFDAATEAAVRDVAGLYEKDTEGVVNRELWNVMADIYSALTYND